jgi:hypothetical protein
MPNPVIFVSSPYTHVSPEVVDERVRQVTDFVYDRLIQDEVVMSPVIYGHTLTQSHSIPGSYEFWKTFCLSFLAVSERVYVLCLPGWKESNGVADEIAFAKERGLYVEYVVPAEGAVPNTAEHDGKYFFSDLPW